MTAGFRAVSQLSVLGQCPFLSVTCISNLKTNTHIHVKNIYIQIECIVGTRRLCNWAIKSVFELPQSTNAPYWSQLSVPVSEAGGYDQFKKLYILGLERVRGRRSSQKPY